MRGLLLFAVCFVSQAAVALAQPGDLMSIVDLDVTILRLKPTAVVPNEIPDPAQVIKELRGSDTVAATEHIKLSSVSGREVKFTRSVEQPVIRGYSIAPIGRPGGFSGRQQQANPFPGGTPRSRQNTAPEPGTPAPQARPETSPPTSAGNSQGRNPLQSQALPTIAAVHTGTTISLKPSVTRNGMVLMQIAISQSRLDELPDDGTERQIRGFTRFNNVETSLVAASGQTILLQADEASSQNQLAPAGRLLIAVTAAVSP